MNNLTTRRIIFGLLMTLVLMFGVQGTADAVKYPTVTDETLIDDTNQTIGTNLTFLLPTLTADNDTKADEEVTIKISSGILLTTEAHYGKSTVTLAEDGESGSNLNVSSLIGRFLTAGKQTIEISGTDYDKEASDPSFSGRWKLTYIYYVTQPAPNTATINLANLRNGYKAEVYRDISIYGGDRKHYAVTYDPNDGLTYKIPGRTGDIPVPDRAISSAFKVSLTGDTNSNVITATVSGSELSTTGAYFYGQPVLTTEPTGDDTGSDTNQGKANALLTDAFTATVAGGDADTDTGLEGILVKFEVSDKTSAGGNLVFTEVGGSGSILVDSSNKQIWNAGRNARVTEGGGKTLYIRTGSAGAKVDFRLGTAAEQKVTISAVGKSKEVSAFTDVSENYELSLDEIQDISGKYGLYVLAEKAEEPLQLGWDVVFTTARGEFEGTGIESTEASPADFTAPTDGGRRIVQHTNEQGIAYVIFDPKGSSGPLEVTASIKNNTDYGDDDAIIVAQLTFDALSGAPNEPLVRVARLTIRVDGTGTRRAVTVTAINAQGANIPGLRVALTGTALTTSRVVNTGTATVITLPTTPDDYTITATFSGYASDTETVTVAASAALGTFSITTVDAPVNGQQTIEVTVLNANGARASVPVTVTLVGPGISRTVETTRGSGRAIITIPTTTTSYTLTVRADGYTRKQETFTTTGQRAEAPAPPSGPAGEADSVEIDGSRTRSGTVNEELAAPLRVRVVDANDNGVEDVRVVFRVLSPGRGTFPGARGSGRATQDDTDQNGYVSVDFTPISTGNVTVRATPAGGIAPVTFIIDVGEAADDDDPEPPTPSRDEAPSREISPVVHLGMASRPPMLWVDGGAIYALVGADVQKFAPGVDNALNITVGGGKVYWTEKTGDAGTINSANVDGSDVKELASIFATPIGIAVDAAGSKLYWTNSRGRIQSADLDGSGITNVIPGGLESPMDLALAGGNGYWTQGNGSVRVGNLTSRVTRVISTGTDTPGSIVIGGNKVYWTEMTGDSSGTIKSANLNGTDVKELTSIQAVPSGIAVDTVRSKLYWTNSRGRVQSANLDGSKITNVVSGLGSPSDMVLSNSITAPAAAPAETASGSKYDVNGDGTVDNADSDAVTVAIAAGATDAKYDVNGDGTVNVFDLVEIIANRDPGAAGAPTLFGMKMSAAQIDSLQEQIDLLIATNDRSPAAMRTLIYLQQLLVTARPEKTLLLANYPNPFNPETWIPYELATDTHVKVTIYNTQGVVIRSLQLGHQSAGYYMGRDRAAYWDGRNALGEQVASGLYFYQLETDAMSLMRKMVILK